LYIPGCQCKCVPYLNVIFGYEAITRKATSANHQRSNYGSKSFKVVNISEDITAYTKRLKNHTGRISEDKEPTSRFTEVGKKLQESHYDLPQTACG
jgi:hypothetical protein